MPKLQDTIDALYESAGTMLDEVGNIEAAWGTDRATMPAGQSERHDRLTRGASAKTREAEDLQSRSEDRAAKRAPRCFVWAA